MKLLDGSEIAGYVQERQAKQVRNLRQAHAVIPRLVIVKTTDDPVIELYVRMKQAYGSDIGVDVDVRSTTMDSLEQTIGEANADMSVHGIIVQLPLADPGATEAMLNLVDSSKDVDGLSSSTLFTPATALAIDWLINGYNITLKDKRIAVVGAGRLVGSPVAALWRSYGYNVTIFDEKSGDIVKKLRRFPVIITATGTPGLIKSQSVQPGAVVVDASTASESGKILGDVDQDVRERSDITITPVKGGVGPLTVCALFDNVIRAARASLDSTHR